MLQSLKHNAFFLSLPHFNSLLLCVFQYIDLKFVGDERIKIFDGDPEPTHVTVSLFTIIVYIFEF